MDPLLKEQMIEKHASSQSASLAELQSELRSLKTLLQSRQAALTAGPGHYISGQNDASTSNGHASVQSASVGGGGISETQRAANALLVPKGKGKGIPAWQLAPSHTDAGGSSPSLSGSPKMSPPGSTSGTTSAEGSLAGSEVLPDKA
jgi:peroxin-14